MNKKGTNDNISFVKESEMLDLCYMGKAVSVAKEAFHEFGNRFADRMAAEMVSGDMPITLDELEQIQQYIEALERFYLQATRIVPCGMVPELCALRSQLGIVVAEEESPEGQDEGRQEKAGPGYSFHR